VIDDDYGGGGGGYEDDVDWTLSTRSGSESCRPCIVQIHKYKIIVILTITRTKHNTGMYQRQYYILYIFVLHANAGSAHLGRPVWTLYYPTNHFHLSRYWTKSFGTVSARHLSPPPGISAEIALNTIRIRTVIYAYFFTRKY